MGCMLGLEDGDMGEALQSTGNVTRHGIIARAIQVVPFDGGEAAIPFASPVEADLIVFL